MNILIPMAGPSLYFNEPGYEYPKPLLQVGGVTVIELVGKYLKRIDPDARFIFVISKQDAEKYFLDEVLRLVFGDRCQVIAQPGASKGAICTCLLAIEHINNDQPLVVSNCDQVITGELEKHIQKFKANNADAGVVTFESVHPRCSYVKTDSDEENVIEVAEKKPISKKAIAGFYYFKTGKTFLQAAYATLMKDTAVNGLFYIAPTLNEIILEGGRVLQSAIAKADYHTFYNASHFAQFEDSFKNGRVSL